MTKSLSATIAGLQRLLAASDQRTSELRQQRTALESEHRERMARLEQQIEVARAEAVAYRNALELVEPLTSESGDATVTATVQHVGRRKRGIGSFWRKCFSGMPVAPAPGVPVQEVYAIVHRADPNVSQNNVRSQLNAAKGRGDVELVDGGWRLTRPLDPPAVTQNEASQALIGDDASDTEGSETSVSEPSEFNPPQSWFTADAAD